MPRRFNYTQRQRILREHVNIRVVRQEDGGLSFDGAIDLSGYEIEKRHPEARVFVEAYRGATASWKRFALGSVDAITLPPDRSLDSFKVPEGILFRVRVTATDAEGIGRLVAVADGVRPQLPGDDLKAVQPLIQHMAADDIGDEVWRLDFSGEMPLLKINSRIGVGVDQFLMDPRYRAVFAPAVMRQILARVLLVERYIGDEDDEMDWRQRWLRFAMQMCGSDPVRAEAADDIQLTDDWIDDAVEGFAKRIAARSSLDCGEAA